MSTWLLDDDDDDVSIYSTEALHVHLELSLYGSYFETKFYFAFVSGSKKKTGDMIKFTNTLTHTQ